MDQDLQTSFWVNSQRLGIFLLKTRKQTACITLCIRTIGIIWALKWVHCLLVCRRSRRLLYLTGFFTQLLQTAMYCFSWVLLSVNTSKDHSSQPIDRISMKLYQNDHWPWAKHLMTFDLGQGHAGVTGVKKVISRKKIQLPQVMQHGHVTHVYEQA